MEYGAQRPNLLDVIENIGFGWAQIMQVLVAAVWALDGAVIILLSCITPTLDSSFHCGPGQRALVLVSVLIGILLGDLVAGPTSELVGRRRPIVLAFMGICLFQILATLAPTYVQLLLCLFPLGLSLGLGQPSLNSLLTEITPMDRRLFVITMSRMIWVAGCSYACVIVWLDNPQMQDLSWRWLVRAVAIPSAAFSILALFFLYESPIWLAVYGQQRLAMQVLASMGNMNSKRSAVVEFEPPRLVTVGPAITMVDSIRGVWNEKLSYTTSVAGLIAFGTDYVTYGMRYTTPQVWPQLETMFSPAIMMLISGTCECPGYVLGILIGSFVSRKMGILLSLAGLIISGLVLAICVNRSFISVEMSASRIQVLFQVGFVGVQMFNAMTQQVLFVYVSEVFPTTARTMGSGVVFGFGRFGAILAPFVYEMFVLIGWWRCAWFWTIPLLAASCFILGVALPFETYGVSLKDHMDEMFPFAPRQTSRSCSYASPSS
eukprot:TRINITY_DN49866_c0_g1_i1.p1 TRINITY_DN49866_c0_g1~~TRINITY_DN49866_c0_g1_i1.p1  ORF type:complete len:489 (-),score=49.62 TRINITY_DN49866_c0_g1_i1:238-1704(-)